MLHTLISSSLKLRFALWAAEQALPSGADLKVRLKSGLLGIGAAIAGGVLGALIFAALMVVGFFVLKGEGVPPYTAAGLMIALTVLAVIYLLNLCKQYLAEATATLKTERVHPYNPSGGLVHSLVDGFLNGLTSPRSAKEKREELLRKEQAKAAKAAVKEKTKSRYAA